jgi:hypothetical protein
MPIASCEQDNVSIYIALLIMWLYLPRSNILLVIQEVVRHNQAEIVAKIW